MSNTAEILASEGCVPCGGGIPALSAAEAQDLLRLVPDWVLLDDAKRIERRFRFKTYAQAFAFVGRVSAIAEAENHHPDVAFGWGYATLSLQTHAIKGLHRNDFILAAKVDRLAGPTVA